MLKYFQKEIFVDATHLRTVLSLRSTVFEIFPESQFTDVELGHFFLGDNVHEAVMVNEVLDNLILDDQGHYLDCTYGMGGHSKAMLNKLSLKGFLHVMDRDPHSTQLAQNLADRDKRVNVIKTSPQKNMLILRLLTKKLCGLVCQPNFQLRLKKVGSPIKKFDTRIRLTLYPHLKH